MDPSWVKSLKIANFKLGLIFSGDFFTDSTMVDHYEKPPFGRNIYCDFVQPPKKQI